MNLINHFLVSGNFSPAAKFIRSYCICRSLKILLKYTFIETSTIAFYSELHLPHSSTDPLLHCSLMHFLRFNRSVASLFYHMLPALQQICCSTVLSHIACASTDLLLHCSLTYCLPSEAGKLGKHWDFISQVNRHRRLWSNANNIPRVLGASIKK